MPRAAFLSLFGRGYLDAVELRGLSQLANKVEFRAGKTIFSEGDPANAVFGLSRGLVRLYKSLPDGRRQVLAFAVPGDLVGMPLRERHAFSADAIGEVAAWRLFTDRILSTASILPPGKAISPAWSARCAMRCVNSTVGSARAMIGTRTAAVRIGRMAAMAAKTAGSAS
jgi:CRP-like cAMP-binding protein